MPREPSKGDLRAVLRGISRALESSRSVPSEEPLPEKLAALVKRLQPSNDSDRQQSELENGTQEAEEVSPLSKRERRTLRTEQIS